MIQTADVVVVGAGPGGIAAAVTAARNGRHTVLLEKEAFAGGIPVKGHISTLCGIFLNSSGKNGPRMLYDAFVREFSVFLMRLDGVVDPIRMGRAYVLPCRPKSFALATHRFLENEPALTVHYGARFCGVKSACGRIQSVEADLNGRRYWIKPGAVIDASGNASVCRAAGARLISPDEIRQVPAVIFPLHQVESAKISTIDTTRSQMMIRHAVERAFLPKEAASVSFLPMLDPGGVLVKLNLGAQIKTNLKISEEMLGRKANALKKALVRFLKQNVAGFEKCTTPASISPVLHRESARGSGRYVLAVQDVLSGKKFPDAAAKGCWPVERWDEKGNLSVHYLADGQYYEIPEDALRSSKIDNLFMAGKSISADSGAIASARVIGCCLATGEAAANLAEKILSPTPSPARSADNVF